LRHFAFSKTAGAAAHAARAAAHATGIAARAAGAAAHATGTAAQAAGAAAHAAGNVTGKISGFAAFRLFKDSVA